mgnify:CR=1 FL=1
MQKVLIAKNMNENLRELSENMKINVETTKTMIIRSNMEKKYP